MKKRKILVPALLAIAMSGSLIAGATYSLFTSTSSHDITVSSGKVALESTIDEASLKLGSIGIDKIEGTDFPNGGTAAFQDNILVLDKVTPGDKVTFNINLKNYSTVKINYRITLRCKSGAELFSALVITPDINSGWKELQPEQDPSSPKTEVKTVTVSLPQTAGDEYQGLNTAITINVEAVQANGTDKYNPSTIEFDKVEDQVSAAKMTHVLKSSKPSTMKEAVDTLKKNDPSYDLETITPKYPETNFVYNLKDNKVNAVLREDLITAIADANNWVIVKNENELNTLTERYSVYLASNFEESGDNVLTPKLGLDMGLVDKNYTINYDNAETSKIVNFNTNSGTLNINAANDTVNHYGVSHNVNITNVAKNSYHEFGEVLGNINLTAGRVVAETGSKVASVVIKATDVGTVKVEDKTETNVTVVATDKTVAQNISKAVTGTTNAKVEKVEEATLSKFAGGLGTKESPYLINSAENFVNINDLVDEMTSGKYFNFKLINDIDLTQNSNAYLVKYFNGTIDGRLMNNNVANIYTSNENQAIFQRTFYNSVFENFNIRWDNANKTDLYYQMAAFSTDYKKFHSIGLTIDNVDYYGQKNSIYHLGDTNGNLYSGTIGNWNMAYFMSVKDNKWAETILLDDGEVQKNATKRSGLDLKIINCDVDAKLYANGYSAIFSSGQHAFTNLTIKNCSFNGSLVGEQVALVIANGTFLGRTDNWWGNVVTENIALNGNITLMGEPINDSSIAIAIKFAKGNELASKVNQSIVDSITGKENFKVNDKVNYIKLDRNGNNNELVINKLQAQDYDKYELAFNTGSLYYEAGGEILENTFGRMAVEFDSTATNLGVYEGATSIARTQITPEMKLGDVTDDLFIKTTKNGYYYTFKTNTDGKMYFIVDLEKSGTLFTAYKLNENNIIRNISLIAFKDNNVITISK